MTKVLSSQKMTDLLTALALLLAVASLVVFPADAVEAAKGGLELCMNVIIPSLFPFFVLSSLCVQLGLIRSLGEALEPLMQPLFRLNGCCAAAFALGIIGGYPVGAKTALSLYENGDCTKDEAERLLAFCNNSGPAFILGVVGAGVFSSGFVGVLLYSIHILASVLIGIALRFRAAPPTHARRRRTVHSETVSFTEAFTTCVSSSFFSTLTICAFVIFFTVVIRMLFKSGLIALAASAISAVLAPLGFTSAWSERLLVGAIEMSSGVWSLQSISGSLTGKLSMAAFILGWAGVSVHFQVLSFVGKSGLSARRYVLGKLCHGLLSAALVMAACKVFSIGDAVPAYYEARLDSIAALQFSASLRTACLSAFFIWMLILCLSVLFVLKTTGKKKNHVV